jgi:CRISPR-associated protein Cas5t
MDTFWLYARAPFAAFRWMQAGKWRATSPVIPPSAAWGLLLNLAHIDTRELESWREGLTTLIRPDAPSMQLAVGTLRYAQPPCAPEPIVERSALYQQLHSYPVGASSRTLAERTHGAKYHIAPIHRELLCDVELQIGVRTEDDTLRERVARGLRGELDAPRYGLPFAGDNNMLFDELSLLDTPRPCLWYALMQPGARARRGSCRLTTRIDRADASRTEAPLFAPHEEVHTHPPDAAWVHVGPLA